MRPTLVPLAAATPASATARVAATGSPCDLEFALIAPASPTLEGALWSLIGGETGLTGYLPLEAAAGGRPGFLLMLSATADRQALGERLGTLGVPPEQLTGRVFPPQETTAATSDNLVMLLGLMNREGNARRIGADRRARRRAA